jgi:hypothetical protein
MHKPQVQFNVPSHEVYVQLIFAQDFTFALYRGFYLMTFFHIWYQVKECLGRA